ncbi:MAG TPA: transglycosylase SLT domain-containing protein [Burkholderiaceae bacterium]|nr:transglycosylase SLT domain-containing protein [Burkholderiaceae bacterium]
MRSLRPCLRALVGAAALAAVAAEAQPAGDAQAAETTTAAAIAPARMIDPATELRFQPSGGDDIEQLIDLISNPASTAPVEPAAAPAPDRPPAPKLARPAAPKIDLWERIRRGFALPDLTTKYAVQATRWYSDRPDYIERMSSRASMYLFHIVEEIEKRGMPMELALLPFVESAMQPEAESHAKAVGLWQFIPSTGKLYSLEQNPFKDERRGVIESTRAALEYLQNLHDEFGDWHLALAAYNCGEGCVTRAVQRSRATRKPADYSSLRLPRETQYYVPKLQAIKNIVRDPAKYGLELPAIRNEPYFVALTRSRDIDVATAARLAEMPVDEFRALNPAFKRPVIVAAAQPTILLPADRAETFGANLAAYEATGQPLASWTTYTLRENETLAQVASRVGLSEASLRDANRIPPRYRLAPRSTILIPRDETMEDDIAPEKVAASFAVVPEQSNYRQITYRVRKGDTLYSVARRWNVKPEEVVAWNNLRGNELFAGQRLSLTIARAAAKKPAGTHKTAAVPTTAGSSGIRSAAATQARQ